MVSIIIPAYNAEATIIRAIESVVAQVYSNWELIIVNDGSSDKTESICSEYIKQDNRIKYLYQENSGPAAARNKGINSAIGQYLTFLDADDTYHPEFLIQLITEAKTSNADIVICGFNKISNSISTPICQPFKSKQTTNEDWLRCFFYDNPGGIASLWNKIYKRETIRERAIVINKNKRHGEDWKFNLDLLTSGPLNLSVVDSQLYNYYDTAGSITKIIHVGNGDGIFEAAKLLDEINRRFKLNETRQIQASIAMGIISYALNAVSLEPNDAFSKIKNVILNPLAINIKPHIWSLRLAFKFKIVLHLLYHGRPGYFIFKQIASLRS